MHFTLAASGCAWFRPAPDTVLQTATAEELTARLQAQAEEVQTLKGLFRAQIQGAGLPITQRVEGAVVFERPDQYRVRGFSRMGTELFELILARNLYRLRLGTDGRLYSGRADELPRIGPVAEPFRLTVFALSGITGLAAVPDGARVALAQDGDRYRLDVFEEPSAASPDRRLWFDRRTLQIVQEERFGRDGTTIASARYEDFRLVDAGGAVPARTAAADSGILRPFRIVVQDSRAGGMMVLTFQELTVNVPLTPGELRPEPRPAAVPVEPAS